MVRLEEPKNAYVPEVEARIVPLPAIVSGPSTMKLPGEFRVTVPPVKFKPFLMVRLD